MRWARMTLQDYRPPQRLSFNWRLVVAVAATVVFWAGVVDWLL